MPRFFHTDSHTRFNDADGLDLVNIAEARAVAAKTVADLLRDNAELFWGSRPWQMTVTDDRALILFTLEVDGQSSPAVQKDR